MKFTILYYNILYIIILWIEGSMVDYQAIVSRIFIL